MNYIKRSDDTRTFYDKFILIDDIKRLSEYIVENPKEVVVQFPIISDIKLDEHLPFFRSISAKLAAL